MDVLQPKSARTEDKIMTPLLVLGDGFFILFYTISTPYIALYILKHTHYQPDSIGWVAGLSTFIGIICAFLVGNWSDYFGRPKLIYYSLLGISGAYFIYYLSASFLSNIWLLIMFTLLGAIVNISTSIYHPISRAFLADYLPYEKKAKSFQLLYMASNTGGILAPLLAIYFKIAATPTAFITSASLFLIYALTFFKLAKKINYPKLPLQDQKADLLASSKFLFKDHRFIYYIISGFGFGICCSQFDISLPQYLNSFLNNAVKIFSLLIVTNSVTVIVSQWFIFKLTKSYGPSLLISLGYLIIAMGFYLISAHHLTMLRLFLSVIVMSIGQVLVFPNYNRFIDAIAPPHLKGAYFGASFLRLFGCSVGPVMGGYFLKYYNGEILFYVTSLIALISSVLQSLTMSQPCIKVTSHDGIS